MKSRPFTPPVPLLFFWLTTLVSLLTSADVARAASWAEATVPSSQPLRAIRYLNGRWFAVGDAGTLLVSANGLDWNQVNVGTTVNLTDIAWGNAKFVLVSAGSHDDVVPQTSSDPARFVSSDGLAWMPVVASTTIAGWGSPFLDNSLSIDRIRFARDRFVALAAPRMHDHPVGEPRTVLTSLDGESWSASQSVGLNFNRGQPIFDILADAGVTVVAGPDLLASSTDGATWTDDNYTTDPWHNPSPLQNQLVHAYGYRVLGRVNDSFVALGFNMRAASTDGVNWQKTVLSNQVVPLTFNGGLFYGRADSPGDNRLFYSVDGRVWTDAGQGPGATVDSLTFAGQGVVALSGNRIFRAMASDLLSVRPAKLLNLSFRGRVGAGEDVLIGGFVIGGDSPMRVLIRGVGPGLAKYGVTDPLANPKLVLFNSKGDTIGNNDNWGQATDPSALRDAAVSVGAFPLIEGGNDAAMLVTLEPGVYTVQVVSVDGSAGVALGEVYEVP